MLLQKLNAIITITAVSTVSFMIQVASAEDEKRKVNPETDKAYEHVIAPILASRCTGCHGAIKAKGKFRLHTKEEIQKSETVVGGKVGESSLIERIMLPDDDDVNMFRSLGSIRKSRGTILCARYVYEEIRAID